MKAKYKKPIYETLITYLIWSSGASLIFKDLINDYILIIYMVTSLLIAMYLITEKFDYREDR